MTNISKIKKCEVISLPNKAYNVGVKVGSILVTRLSLHKNNIRKHPARISQ